MTDNNINNNLQNNLSQNTRLMNILKNIQNDFINQNPDNQALLQYSQAKSKEQASSISSNVNQGNVTNEPEVVNQLSQNNPFLARHRENMQRKRLNIGEAKRDPINREVLE